jgi:sugar-specific transcriptional regulator TrmB
MSSIDHLIELGLNKNEAKALDALITLGPSGASDVHKHTGMPRNKAYESLERLARRGMIEIQQGRQTLYRAMEVKAIINNMLEDYSKEAKEALSVLEKKQEDIKEEREYSMMSDLAWIVRGEFGTKRRLAELIYGAKEDIFAIGGYPPKYLLAVKTALKAATKRGVKIRPISMIMPFKDVKVSSGDSSVFEFRTALASPKLFQKIDPYEQKLIDGFKDISCRGSIVIIDELTTFMIVDDGKDPKKVAGIVFRAPGTPRVQKATVERIIELYTRKVFI